MLTMAPLQTSPRRPRDAPTGANRRTAESTVSKGQALLLMVAWVETPGGGLRERTGMPHPCVRGRFSRHDRVKRMCVGSL